MKLYVAGPMTGIPHFNFPAFDNAATLLRNVLGIVVVSPAEMDDPETRKASETSPDGDLNTFEAESGKTWGDLLARDVKLIADEVDGVIVLPGWEQSKGARLEVFVACSTGKPVYDFERWAKYDERGGESDQLGRDHEHFAAGVTVEGLSHFELSDGWLASVLSAETFFTEIVEAKPARDEDLLAEMSTKNLYELRDHLRKVMDDLIVNGDPEKVFGFPVIETEAVPEGVVVGIDPSTEADETLPIMQFFSIGSPLDPQEAVMSAKEEEERVAPRRRKSKSYNDDFFPPDWKPNPDFNEVKIPDQNRDETNPASEAPSDDAPGYGDIPWSERPKAGEVRTTSATGGEKGVKPQRMDLIPVEFMLALSEVYGMGAEKYDDHNYIKGYEWSKSLAAMLRHIAAWANGESRDPESGLSHLLHAAWHCSTLFLFERHNLGTDDRLFHAIERQVGGPDIEVL